jgi:putative peptidyl-prolyl cis-trans isomerase
MKKIKLLLSALAICLIPGSPLMSWETYDSVIAVVNDLSIIESEIDSKFNQLIKVKNVPRSRHSYEKSRILDKFIEDALVLETATDEAIVVSDRRVLGHIEEMMKQHFAPQFRDEKTRDKEIAKMINRLEKRLTGASQMDDRKLDARIDEFIAVLENRAKISFKDYFEEIRSQIMREQVMSIAIGVSPPAKEEALAWYKKNRAKLGDEVWVKHILVKPKGGSFTAERDANNTISDLRSQIMAGASFEAIARAHSQDPESSGKGGDLGWKMLAEMDPYFAGFVNQLRGRGTVSQIFKSGMGYHIVKLMGRRPLTFDRVERLIMYKLYNESLTEQFKKWVRRRIKESEIQIFMPNYVQA